MTNESIRVRWGVMGAARIAVKHVIPATQVAPHCRVHAIASRDRAKAHQIALQFGITRVHGSYDDLLADPEVDAVYIPLPNDLHVPWSLRALDAGKHVLCEKPIGMTAAEAETLRAAALRHPRLRVMEAFMYRFHPQWQMVRRLIADAAIGSIGAVHTAFSYFNVDPMNVRNL